MTFIIAPSTNFSGSALVNLDGAVIAPTKRAVLPSGTYQVTSADHISPVFTPTGNNAILGGFVAGDLAHTFLIAPDANFSAGRLTSLSGAVLSQSATVTGLLGGVAYRALALTSASYTVDVALPWIITGTVVEQAPLPFPPTIPTLTDGIVTGPSGTYRITNTTNSSVLEVIQTPPFSAYSYGDPGDAITVEYITFSGEGPEIEIPALTQILVTAVGTLARSGGDVTLTPATWDTADVTVTRTKTINGLETALVGTTFSVAIGETYFVTEIASKTGFMTSAPASTEVDTRPSGLAFVGGKTTSFAGTTSNQTISLTDLVGGLDTAPLAGDLVIVGYASGANGMDLSLAPVTSGYTVAADLYSNDNYDANLTVAYKFMSGTPDASIQVTGTGSGNNAGAVAIHVWRGAAATPLDVSAVTATGINGGRPTPGAITPTTAGAVVIEIGGAGVQTGSAVFTASISNFISKNQSDTYHTAVGMGSSAWTSGTFTPAAWTGGTTNVQDSWAAVTLALRPEV